MGVFWKKNELFLVTILQHRSASMMDQYIVRTGADLIPFLTFIASIFKGEKLYIF